MMSKVGITPANCPNDSGNVSFVAFGFFLVLTTSLFRFDRPATLDILATKELKQI